MTSSEFFCGGPVSSRQIYPFLEKNIPKAESIDLAVSFVRLSGVRMLVAAFEKALARGTKIRLLCGSYLGITEPAALHTLVHDLSGSIEMRLFEDPYTSFHPKCWILNLERETKILIGSSNLSRSALTSGIEWNYSFSDRQDPKSVSQIKKDFAELWEQSAILDEESISQYAKRRIVPAGKPLRDLLFPEEEKPEPGKPAAPNAMQTEALYALQESRKKGLDRALVQAATGTGKTWLAAFDSMKYPRVLFVAHRKEILDQARKTFHLLRPQHSTGMVLAGRREIDRDMVFASVFSLANPALLNEDVLAPDAFDYIVIDEFHHAAAGSYKKILDYFRPKFLLGLTATPYRLDGRDLYALCSYNVPYRIDLFSAISQGYLCPFRYFGIYDPTDYAEVKIRGMKFDLDELDALYVDNEKRADLIRRHYLKHGSARALGFCASRSHARFMAAAFRKAGIQAASVVSDPRPDLYFTDLNREEALEKLSRKEVSVLFCVDLFNEGTDIPDLDLVMFLRPTESAVVYLQQLGRGLRKAKNKDHLTVLDFIGNYRSAALGPSLVVPGSVNRLGTSPGALLPASCFVDFDLELIDLFENLRKRSLDPFSSIKEMVEQVKERLGHVPGRLELFSELSEDNLEILSKHRNISPLKDYLKFMDEAGLLSGHLEKLRHTPAGEFLLLASTTNMSKVYKLPVLRALIHETEDGLKIRRHLTEEEALESWKDYFRTGGRWIDLGVNSLEEFEAIPDKVHLRKIRSMPVKYLLSSFDGFLLQEKGDLLTLNPKLDPWLEDQEFIAQLRDVLDYRGAYYYDMKYKERCEAAGRKS